MNPAPPQTIEELDDALSAPSDRTIECLARVAGDLLLIGVGGKMGPTLARMARRASTQAGRNPRIIGVSRFSTPGLAQQLRDWGVETIACDLFAEEQVDRLPAVENVVCMLGFKFGTSDSAARTWATNTYLPALLCRKFRNSNLVAFSTGNVYPLVPVSSQGPTEEHPLDPVGEYGMSALGRERIFEFFSRQQGTPMTLIRLNYACECRYGVLVDIALRVWTGQPVPLAMGYFNVLWQGDANAYALQCLETTASPPTVLNMTGPEVLGVRQAAQEFARLLGKPVQFEGTEGRTALLNNSRRLLDRFGLPRLNASQLMGWIADWVRRQQPVLNKPTHFEVRDGRF
jgi:nucleoside-diphosphate-sugar epimerase